MQNEGEYLLTLYEHLHEICLNFLPKEFSLVHFDPARDYITSVVYF